MAKNQWPLEMAPASMLPAGMSQQMLAEYLRLHGMPGSASQFPDAPPVWPTPQSSPEFSDPDNWLGPTRNALAGPQTGRPPIPFNILALLNRMGRG